jgi:hypothetical protein
MYFEMLKNRFSQRVFANKERTVSVALDNAYADMSRRQNGHIPELKECCIDYLVEVFSTPLQTDDFDAWHKALTDQLVARWNNEVTGFGTVGKAQKVINMAFKYIACISHDFDAVLPHCHMTLDSYTLEWYENNVKPWLKAQHRNAGRKVSAWSKIESYDDYILIQHNIRDYLAAGVAYSIHIGSVCTSAIQLPTAPIDAEFIVWEGQIIVRKYSGLIKVLENYVSENCDQHGENGYDTWLIGTIFQEYLTEYINRF